MSGLVMICKHDEVDGSVQDCGNFIANTLGLLQSYAKPLKWVSKDYIWENVLVNIAKLLVQSLIW